MDIHKLQEAYITQALLYYSTKATTKKYRTQAVMSRRQSHRQSAVEALDNVRYRRGHAASVVPDLCACACVCS